MSAPAYGMRLTMCECGHEAIAHYDSHDFCTHTMDGACSCQKFKAAGAEILVRLPSASGENDPPIS